MKNNANSIPITEILQEVPTIGDYFKDGKVIKVEQVNIVPAFTPPWKIVVEDKSKVQKEYFVMVMQLQAGQSYCK